jgi:hypothetical protein
MPSSSYMWQLVYFSPSFLNLRSAYRRCAPKSSNIDQRDKEVNGNMQIGVISVLIRAKDCQDVQRAQR